MSVHAYRIIKKKHELHLFDGEGAYRFGGRWNSPNRRIVYCAGSRSLAILEMLVHLEEHQLLQEYVMADIEFPEEILEKLPSKSLPQDWSVSPVPDSTKEIGDLWIEESRSAVLMVPSAIVPDENNFLINPDHDDFEKLTLGKPRGFEFDSRLLKMASSNKVSRTRKTKKKKS